LRTELSAELAHIGGVDVAVQDAGHVVAAVDGDELSAERVAVAVFEEYLLAYLRRLCPEVHCHVLSVEGEARERDTLHGIGLRHLYRGGVGDYAVGVVERLFGIIELYSSHLRGRLYSEKWVFAVGYHKQRACGLGSVGNCCAASRRTMNADE